MLLAPAYDIPKLLHVLRQQHTGVEALTLGILLRRVSPGDKNVGSHYPERVSRSSHREGRQHCHSGLDRHSGRCIQWTRRYVVEKKSHQSAGNHRAGGPHRALGPTLLLAINHWL